jgi:hypothetical protein
VSVFVDQFSDCQAVLLGCTDRRFVSTLPPLFLIGIVRGGVQLGPLVTAVTNRPIVPAPSAYDDGEIGGMMIGKGNRSTREKTCPSTAMSTTNPTCLPGREPGLPRWEARTNRLSYGTARLYPYQYPSYGNSGSD